MATIDSKIYQDLKLLTLRDDFSIKVNKLRDKYIYFDEEHQVALPFVHNDFDGFSKDLQKLIQKFKIPTSHYWALGSYILYDHLYPSSGTPLLMKTKDELNNTCLAIRIGPETKLKDIISAWKEIEKEQIKFYGHITKKSISIKNIERNIELCKLKKEGKTGKEIVKIINKRYPRNPISYQDIPKIIARTERLSSKES